MRACSCGSFDGRQRCGDLASSQKPLSTFLSLSTLSLSLVAAVLSHGLECRLMHPQQLLAVTLLCVLSGAIAAAADGVPPYAASTENWAPNEGYYRQHHSDD